MHKKDKWELISIFVFNFFYDVKELEQIAWLGERERFREVSRREEGKLGVSNVI